MSRTIATFLLSVVFFVGAAEAQQPKPPAPNATAQGTTLPADYVIGPEDILGVVFWREQDKALTTDVVVRPDGKISVPMLNDIQAAGLKPEELAEAVEKAAAKYIRDPAATVVVREIHSRKVFVIGEVAKPGAIQIGSELTVLQALAEAGGFLEHANKTDVAIVRKENGGERRLKFNYKEVLKGTKPEQNIRLLPGDTVLVR